ncbi:hypothetical protein QCA50_005420 [Cerrena zonata]|uniref:Secreted protein n=1 Tax=Cerrena zonata TaxID=2478898 RepID=A0AAW0GLP0_9APHY
MFLTPYCSNRNKILAIRSFIVFLIFSSFSALVIFEIPCRTTPAFTAAHVSTSIFKLHPTTLIIPKDDNCRRINHGMRIVSVFRILITQRIERLRNTSHRRVEERAMDSS